MSRWRHSEVLDILKFMTTLQIDQAGELVGGTADDKRRFYEASVDYNATVEPRLLIPKATNQVLRWLRDPAPFTPTR